MDIFELREKLVKDYEEYTRSFIKIKDSRISEKVYSALENGVFWPEPLLQLNPNFMPGQFIDELVEGGLLHKECRNIFRIGKKDNDLHGEDLRLYKHQTEAIQKAREKKSYVLTTGTGSGKSLSYIIPIVDYVLRNGAGNGIKAIVVYPMNALANSQEEELVKFLEKGYPQGGSPVRFARYTGQEKEDQREKIRSNPPDILLTNYMMLELLLTRREDRALIRAAGGLKFLVFDELHTYRGRQGADVALLIRRCRLAFEGDEMICVGTSATMSTEGTLQDQKKAVARVAKKLFGTEITPDQVIGETLERLTEEIDCEDFNTKAELKSIIELCQCPPDNYEEFRKNLLSCWIESTFGVKSDLDSGVLVRQTPRRLRGEKSASQELAELTSTQPDQCEKVLKKYLLKGSDLHSSKSSGSPIFPFRLHQFFTRGDTVWTTIESEENRHLEIAKLVSKPGEPEKTLYPLVFCRQCGTEYYRVSLFESEDGSSCLKPREDRQYKEDDGEEGYLYISSDDPWPVSDSDIRDRLPDFMKETTPSGGERISTYAQKRKEVPQLVFVDPKGKIVSEGQGGVSAALIRGNFLFCLNPECGVAYKRNQRAERGKLNTLGIDNRSTATTILAVKSLIELQSDSSLSQQARKLLSFTDNRQDASLQAGHFNDFTQVALLRSALYKAVKEKNDGLNHAQLSRKVFEAMGLRFEDYATDPHIRGPARNDTDDALRRVINYHLYRDLKWDWRVTAPNLEDCGLLRFEYSGLEDHNGLLNDFSIWTSGVEALCGKNLRLIQTPEVLKNCPVELRSEIIKTLLDFLRRSLAISVDVLNPRNKRDLLDQTTTRLDENTVWYLEDIKELVSFTVAYPHRKSQVSAKDVFEDTVFVSSYGRYGQYLRRSLEGYADDQSFGRKEVDEVIEFLFHALKSYGILEQVDSGEKPGYQINPGSLRWIADEGRSRPVDPTRLFEKGQIMSEVNSYFVNCYKNFVELKAVLEAREHTAQVYSKEREEREERFRRGELPLLFCSPTMELGVDIAQLNLVNLRNVPPTPANYAQRSGRAGRGGQPALVYTYCAGRSPHDQHYFQRPEQMVSGSVAPPNIDLVNQDLIRSHVYAIWMEVAKPNLGKTLMDVIDIINHDNGNFHLPIKDSIRGNIEDSYCLTKAREKVDRFIRNISDEQSETEKLKSWAKTSLDQIYLSFDKSCERWRTLYRSAVQQRETHHKIIGDHSRPEAERRYSRRLREQAESQIRLLTEPEGIYEGDFYSYRYFAVEGFLPGYNFPRLPISAYVPGRRSLKGKDGYISRPRFLAISEFGPQAFVYHEGSRYQAHKVSLDFGPENDGPIQMTMKRCNTCGYAHTGRNGSNLSELCDRCGSADLENLSDLVSLKNVTLKLVQRITCNEEERQRYGYNLITSYKFNESEQIDSEILVNGDRFMRLTYCDSTDIYRINLGWATQREGAPAGFNLDIDKGYWASRSPDDEDDVSAASVRIKRVVPYVTDTKNVLVFSFKEIPEEPVMAGLQSALKRAIQEYFQLEPTELSCEAMPSARDHNRQEILFYEATEGGAGVLRQLVEKKKIIPDLARKALEICRFDPDTLEDLGSETCGKACYKCLLDYYNQPDHSLLDRHLIRDFLAQLAHSESKLSGGLGSRSERIEKLRKVCDSDLERQWLNLLEKQNLKLPSDAQYQIEECSTRSDFFYKKYNVAIYIDGPPHDRPDQIRNDEEIKRKLIESGYSVIRFHHKEDWKEVFRQHPDIFGTFEK